MKKIILFILVLLLIITASIIYYALNSRVLIDTSSINNINGGLGTGNDMSYIWEQLPKGIQEENLINIEFKNTNKILKSECAIKRNDMATQFAKDGVWQTLKKTEYYCQATWPIDVSGLANQEGYNHQNYLFYYRIPVKNFVLRLIGN